MRMTLLAGLVLSVLSVSGCYGAGPDDDASDRWADESPNTSEVAQGICTPDPVPPVCSSPSYETSYVTQYECRYDANTDRNELHRVDYQMTTTYLQCCDTCNHCDKTYWGQSMTEIWDGNTHQTTSCPQ